MTDDDAREDGTRGQGDALLEMQAAIDEMVRIAWERYPEAGQDLEDDVRAALVDVRPIVRELDALWLHLRQTRGR